MESLLADAERHKMYLVYKAIFELADFQRKHKLLSALGGGFKYSWRVTGITPNALELLALNDYRYAKGVVCRAHKVDRIATAREAFNRAEPLTEGQLFKLIWDNDETVIATKSENKLGGILSHAIPISYELGLFLGAKIGWRHGKDEIAFLRKLHLDHKARTVTEKDLRN